MNIDRIKDIEIHNIDTIMRKNGRSLNDYPPIPISTLIYVESQSNVLLMEELKYNTDDMQRQYESMMSTITSEQKHIFIQ